METYNGYRSYKDWNQSLWINNDETMYEQARALAATIMTPKNAAKAFIELQQNAKTPDGVTWSIRGVKGVMEELKKEIEEERNNFRLAYLR